jgi:hypothetical protein
MSDQEDPSLKEAVVGFAGAMAKLGGVVATFGAGGAAAYYGGAIAVAGATAVGAPVVVAVGAAALTGYGAFKAMGAAIEWIASDTPKEPPDQGKG